MIEALDEHNTCVHIWSL